MMCKSMEDMRNEAAKRAAEMATEKTLLQTIKNLMGTTKWTAEQAMDAIKIPESDRIRYMEKL